MAVMNRKVVLFCFALLCADGLVPKNIAVSSKGKSKGKVRPCGKSIDWRFFYGIGTFLVEFDVT